MKIKFIQHNNENWRCNIINDEWCYHQKQFDYMFKHLDFDKLDKNWSICFNSSETIKWFNNKYTKTYFLKEIYKKSPEGYEYLKNNWCKGIFRLFVWYIDKQELKTIVNKVINIKLIRNE